MDVTRIQFLNAMEAGFESVLHTLDGICGALDITIDFDSALDMFNMPAARSGIDLQSWNLTPATFKAAIRKIVESSMFEFEEEFGPVAKGSRNCKRNQPHAPSHYNPDSAYLRELIVRGGMTTFQAATALGISHGDLTRHLDPSASPRDRAPYVVQFALKCLIGVRRTRDLTLTPMLAPVSSTTWNCYVSSNTPFDASAYADCFGVVMTFDQVAEIEQAIESLPENWHLLVQHDVGAEWSPAYI